MLQRIRGVVGPRSPVVALLCAAFTDAPASSFSEIRAFLKTGGFDGEARPVVDLSSSVPWELSIPSVVASMRTPPSSALGVGLKSSGDAPDGLAGLKSSGVLEEADGDVWASLCRTLGGGELHLPLRTKA